MPSIKCNQTLMFKLKKNQKPSSTLILWIVFSAQSVFLACFLNFVFFVVHLNFTIQYKSLHINAIHIPKNSEMTASWIFSTFNFCLLWHNYVNIVDHHKWLHPFIHFLELYVLLNEINSIPTPHISQKNSACWK